MGLRQDTQKRKLKMNSIHQADAMAAAMEADAGDPSCWEPEDFVQQHLKGSIFKIGETFYVEEDEYVTDAEASIVKETENCYLRLHIEASFWAVSKKVEIFWWFDASDYEDFADSAVLDKGTFTITENKWPSVKEILQKINENVIIATSINSLFV